MNRFLGLVFIFLLNFGFADDFLVIDEPSAGYTRNEDSLPPMSDSAYSIEIGSVDTSDQPARGAMISEVNLYENGGMESRVVVGIFEQFSIGVSEKIDGLIGSGMPIVNIPAAFLKFSLFPSARPFNAAVGFNRFAYGINGNVVSNGINLGTQYGAFFVSSFGYRFLDLPHLFTVGLRMPLLPDSFRGTQNISLMAAAQIRWKWFELGLTLENMYFDVMRLDQTILSGIVSLNLADALVLEGIFLGELDGGGIHRLLNVKYLMQF